MDDFYELLHDEPMPEKERKYVYPFSKMQVGDSFIIAASQMARIKSAADRYRQRFAPWCYGIGKDTQGNWRLWRVPDKAKHVKSRY
jgi:hypothetical protein